MKKILVLVLLISFPAYASSLKYIPKWSMCGDQACYTFEQAKQLVVLDSEIDLLYRKLDLSEGIIRDQKYVITNLTEQLALTDQNVELLKIDNDRLTVALKQAVKEKNDAIAQSSNISFGWIVAGAAICIASGLALSIAINK